MFFVYILFSQAHNKYYIGYSEFPEERFIYHNTSPHNSFTSKFRPWEFLLSVPVGNRSQAMKLEKLIKRQKSRDFIKRFLQDENFRKLIIGSVG